MLEGTTRGEGYNSIQKFKIPNTCYLKVQRVEKIIQAENQSTRFDDVMDKDSFHDYLQNSLLEEL
jgi:hypothetical protein